MLQLREYQEESLSALTAYLRLVVDRENADTAFYEMTRRPYRSVPNLESLPYVCLRVPTGGGKTFMACHALGLVAREYLRVDLALCLWLVPSNAIREQTLRALRDRRHPYRQAIDAAFAGRVTVMDLSEALYLQRGTLESDTVIVVTTLQSLRVEETDGRKVYETNGALQHHFDGIPAMMRAVLETEAGGQLVYSLANVLRMRRPVVIMDEAHNARTPLTFDTLTRFFPSCIVEFTATPETKHDPNNPSPNGRRFASNVLHHVSARELKEAEMVKLPIKLRTQADWKAIVSDARNMQRHLEELAGAEEAETGEHIRPIILFQAQSVQGDDVNVHVVRRALIDDFHIPEEQIAIATGTTRGIEDVDLFAQTCPIRFIITVRALVEGWDCSFAYILCSVSEISTPRSVEQVLGRILRLPHAHRKRRAELNCAYAFAASESFIKTAASLRDALIDGAGFQRMEASDFVQVEQQPDLPWPGPLFAGIQPGAREPVPPLRVPLLAIRTGQQLELFDESFLLSGDWDLAACDPTLTQSEFPTVVAAATEGEIDVDEEGRVSMPSSIRTLHRQLRLIGIEPGWTLASLVVWLDQQIEHRDVPQSQSSLFIHQLVSKLMEERGVTVVQLARDKFRLARSIALKIEELRREEAARGYQRLLFGPAPSRLEVSPELCLTYDEDRYAPNWYYDGAFPFERHLFRVVGELKSEGEEFECAVHLDRMDELEVWVRNLERGRSSFWLQTSTDKFYPDFVSRLSDGRILVVEYKGSDRWSNDDSKEKRSLGELWEERSGGSCLFVMPQGPDWAAIDAKIRP